MNSNDPHRVVKSPKVYTVTLTCGHRIKTRDRPWRGDTTFGCTMGTSCGYKLAWVSWAKGSITEENRKK